MSQAKPSGRRAGRSLDYLLSSPAPPASSAPDETPVETPAVEMEAPADRVAGPGAPASTTAAAEDAGRPEPPPTSAADRAKTVPGTARDAAGPVAEDMAGTRALDVPPRPDSVMAAAGERRRPGRPIKHTGAVRRVVTDRAGRERPQRYERVNVILTAEVDELEALADERLRRTGYRPSRSDLLRAFARAILAAGVDLGEAATERQIQQVVETQLRAGAVARRGAGSS